MPILNTIIGHNIITAADYLRQDHLVAIPTETVYGLAANALKEQAVVKIFETKRRPRFNPLILHSYAPDILQHYADFTPAALSLARAAMPGPLALLLPKKETVPDILTAGSAKVVVRIPNHSMSLELLQMVGFPLAAPSANPFGYISPTTAQHVYKNFAGKLPYILDGGPCRVGVESTIAEIMDDHILIHRNGGMAIEEIHEITGLEIISAPKQSTLTSGKLKSHYAPGKPLHTGEIEDLHRQYRGQKIAVVSFFHDYSYLQGVDSFVLSPEKSLIVAAAKLFQTLRNIDTGHYDLILAELFPDTGLGKAINDRLQRAQWIHK